VRATGKSVKSDQLDKPGMISEKHAVFMTEKV
jgi:hypothetical protein